MSRNLDIALRITADAQGAQRVVQGFNQELGNTAARGQQAAAGTNAAAAAATTRLTPALGQAEQAARRAGISIGQYKMAMHQLPMQMTDIFTGLASGQSPMMVLVQQGGQLKDSFGGVVPAAKAVGRAVMGLLNPYTLVAAAAGTLAIAWYKGSQEGARFAQTATMIGEYGGVTASRLRELSAEFDNLEGVTQGKAAAALNQIASTGQFTAEQVSLIGKAALQMEATTGRAIEGTVEEFASLRKDPVKALLELNDKYHFLNESTYEQVKALVDQGRQQDAVKLAMETYAGVVDKRTAEVTENLGYVEQAWRAVKTASAKAVDGVMGIGRDESTADQLQQAQERLALLRKNRPDGGANYFPVQNLEAQVAALQKKLKAEQEIENQKAAAREKEVADSDALRKKVEADKKRDQERKAFADAETRYLSNSERKSREIAEVNDLVTRGVIAQGEATRRIAQIEADYAQKSQKRRAERKTDAQRAQEDAQKELDDLTRQVALNGTLEDGQKRISEQDRIQYDITAGKFRLAAQGTKAQLADQARLLDAQNAAREETEKAQAAYKALTDALQTPVEAGIARVTRQMQDLKTAAKQMSPDENRKRQQAIIDQNITALPKIAEQPYGIGDEESNRQAELRAELEAEYRLRRDIIDAARQQENADQEAWNAASVELEKQRQAQLTALTQAEGQMRLTQTSEAFGSMAEIAKSFGGEQSKTYQGLFAISKAFAAAQLATSLAINIAKASELGFPFNIGTIAAAMTQGAQIAQILSGANYSPSGYAGGGLIRGPGTPTSDSIPIWASDREFMVRAASATQPGAVDFLHDFNRRGMTALHDWARGFADGGQITAMTEPRAQISDNAAMLRSVNNNSLRLYNLFDLDALAERLASHPAMERRIVNVAAENGGAIRASW